MAEFKSSLSGAAPAPGLDAPLAALWWAAKSGWDQAHKLVQDANDGYFAALATQQTVIASAQNAQVGLSQARLDLNQAILDALQTGGVEKVTGQTTTY